MAPPASPPAVQFLNPGTEQGWIYATVEPGGAVTSAGAMESCMECHREAQRGRQFGLP